MTKLLQVVGALIGCTVATVFFVAGLYLLKRGLPLFQSGSKEGIPMLLVGGLFAAIGGGVGLSFLNGFRSHLADGNRKRKYPQEPWKWKREWEGAEIVSADVGKRRGAWLMALVWNILAWVALIASFRKPDVAVMAVLIPLLFVAVGVLLLGVALRATLHHRKFGTTRVVLVPMPGRIGGWLGGAVIVPNRLQAESDPVIVARCLRRVRTGSGKSTRMTETVLWEKKEEVDRSKWQDRGASTELPFLFELPSNLPACDYRNYRDLVIWTLTATAAVPGLDLETTFEVPVYPPADSIGAG